MKSCAFWTVCLAVLNAGPAVAACRMPVVVAVRDVGWSLSIAQDASTHGVIPEFLQLVAERSGCRLRYLNVPLARAYVMLRHGDIAILPAAVRNPERDSFAAHVPTTLTPVLLISRREAPVRVSTLHELSAWSIKIDVLRGANYGTNYMQWLAINTQRDSITELPIYPPMIQRLSMGRTDALIGPLAGVATAVEQFRMHDSLHMEVLRDIPAAPIGFYFTRASKDQDGLNAFQQVAEDMVRQGEYMRLVRKHYPAWAMQGIQAAPLR